MNKRGALVYVGRVAVVLGLALTVACGDKKNDDGKSGSGGGAGKNGSESGKGGGGGGTGGTVKLDGGLVMAEDGAVFVPGTDAGAPILDASRGGQITVPKNCPTPAPNQPPETLSCTGLYADIEKKELGDGMEEFSPAVHLWSDGAEKTRWVYLPPGEKIDVSDPNAWKFPVDTRFFKEFKWDGKRVETRLFWKASSFVWVRTAYKWNEDETEATRTGGEDLMVGGTKYHIPTTTECDQCHKGRVDRALGFETILMGLPEATGLTLAELKKRDLVSGTLPSTIEIGDDGTGHGAEALGWLHVNCGVSCHNTNSSSEAYSTKLSLRLKVADVDGSSTSAVDAITGTVGKDAVTGRWAGRKRITAGSPEDSLLYDLMSTRNATNMKDQMPPIASRVVPEEGAQILEAWISAM